MLRLFASPLSALILKALEKQPMPIGQLLWELGGPSESTLRNQVEELVAIGAVAKRGGGMPYSVHNELTATGNDLMRVVHALAAWLDRALEPIPMGSVAAKGAIKALAGGWESRMLLAIAARPLSLTQIDSLIGSLSYPALDRRLTALRASGLIEAESKGPRVPYVMSRWGREAVGPIAAAAHFERKHLRGSAALMSGDVEGLLLLGIPIATIAGDAAGTCHLVADDSRAESQSGGISVTVAKGQVVDCVARLDAASANRAVCDPTGWLRAIVDRDPSALKVTGERSLIDRLVFGMHDALFASGGKPPA